jgi:hypothetical protein
MTSEGYHITSDAPPPARHGAKRDRFAMISESEIAFLRDCGATPAERFAYVTIALHANDGRACWPSYDTLAGLLGVSRRAVMKPVKGLVERGALAVESRFDGNGRQTSNYFVLLAGEGRVYQKDTLPQATTARVNGKDTGRVYQRFTLGGVPEVHPNREEEHTKGTEREKRPARSRYRKEKEPGIPGQTRGTESAADELSTFAGFVRSWPNYDPAKERFVRAAYDAIVRDDPEAPAKIARRCRVCQYENRWPRTTDGRVWSAEAFLRAGVERRWWGTPGVNGPPGGRNPGMVL